MIFINNHMEHLLGIYLLFIINHYISAFVIVILFLFVKLITMMIFIWNIK